jgi:hypothetical protein
MRLAYHIEVSKKAYILLFITAILHLFSIVFKQLVIQQVHTMRSLDQNISLSTIKIQSLRSSNEIINDLNLIYYLNSVNFFSDINNYGTNLARLNSNKEDFPEKKKTKLRIIILISCNLYMLEIIYIIMIICIFCRIYLKKMNSLNQLMLIKN